MNVIKYQMKGEEELFQKLRQVRLRGFERPFVYKDAMIDIVTVSDADTLYPAQRYVLRSQVDNIKSLYQSFLTQNINIFQLRGFLEFWLEGTNPETDPPIPFLPPLIEESWENGLGVIPLINDGIHRVWAAREIGEPFNIIRVSGLSTQFPYYAFPWPGGLGQVDVLRDLPDVYEKKLYRDPTNYKALFRQFNEVFPGIQEQRKDTNPGHIKA